MKRTVPRLEGAARDIAKGELIGRNARVIASSDAGLVGLSGAVIDETLRTLVLKTDGGRRVRVGKVGQTFEFSDPKRDAVTIDGAAIEFRPAERTKKVR